MIGFPGNTVGSYSFKPQDIPHVSIDPPHEGEICTGLDLSGIELEKLANQREINLEWLYDLHKAYQGEKPFFQSPDFFDKLCGTDRVRVMIQQGEEPAVIRQSWKAGLESYRAMRKKYLLYTDFDQ